MRRQHVASRAHRSALAAIVLAGAALVAGCGNDSEQVSAEELISRGDAICAEGRKTLRSRSRPKRRPTPPPQPSQTDELVEIATDELNELRNIRAPDELRERYDSYLEARGRALELLEQGRDAAEDKDADAYGKAQARAAAEQPERLKLARAVGFETCSKG